MPPEDPARPFEVPQHAERAPRRLRRREPRHERARRRRRARVRTRAHASQAARRHRRLDLPDRPRLKEGTMSNDYDVIIIGSGAGGGTLAYRLAPTGLRDPDPRARRLHQARARELGQPRGDHEGPLQDPREVDRQGRAAVPSRPALLRRRADEVLRLDPLPAPRDRLRRGPPPRRHLARVADLVRRPRAVLRAGRGSSTTCTARPARIRPRPWRSIAVPVPGRQPRAADPAAARRLRARGPATRSTCRSA